MKSLIGFLVVMCTFQIAFAQNGTIFGTVQSEKGLALSEVRIKVKGKFYGTTETGEFVIYEMPYGTYTLSVSKNGYKSVQIDVDVYAPENRITVQMMEDFTEFEEIEIVAERSSNQKIIEIGKLPIRPFDMPQSSAVISSVVMEQQQSQQLSDVLKNTNGVYIMGNSGGYQEEIAGRGFAFGSSNTFKNGIRYNNTILPETSSLERLEILKGSTAILFGNVAAGGVLNLVTKKPQFQKGGEINLRIGSYNFYKPTIDVYGSLNKNNTIAYRVNSTFQNAKSFRYQVHSERFYINPSLLIHAGNKTEILIEGDYMNDDRTADFGVGAIDYQLIDIPRNTFLGFNWNYIKTEQQSLTTTLTHQLGKNWNIRSTNGYQGFNNDLFANVRPNGSGKMIEEDGQWVRGVQRTEIEESYFISQLDLTGKLNTGKIKHTLLFGAEIDQYFTKKITYNGISAYDTVNIFQMNYNAQRNDIPSLTKKTDTYTPTTRSGIYIQDLLAITDKFKILAGVRFSYLEIGSELFTYSTQKSDYSELYAHAFSPRFGVVYQPIKTMSLFSSFANSFAPNTGVDINGKALEPSITDQYELGIKNDLFKGFLSANATVYYIVNSNVAQMVLDNGNTDSNIKELAGEVTSQGVEIDITSKQWKGFNFLAGYSFNDTKYTKSTMYAPGSKLLYQPRNTANSSIYYEFQNIKQLKGLNVGISFLYFGERFGGRLPRLTVENDDRRPIPLPEYLTLDASIGYTKNNMTVRFKISNIFNALSYNVHDDNSVNPIAPRMFMTTLSFKL